MLANPFFHALQTEHAGRAIGALPALRYPADIIPFAARAEPAAAAILALAAPDSGPRPVNSPNIPASASAST
jgi:hypothetical protein